MMPMDLTALGIAQFQKRFVGFVRLDVSITISFQSMKKLGEGAAIFTRRTVPHKIAKEK